MCVCMYNGGRGCMGAGLIWRKDFLLFDFANKPMFEVRFSFVKRVR